MGPLRGDAVILVAVRANAELLKANAPADGLDAELLGEIEHASVRAAELCRQLLAYAGRSRVEMTRVEPKSIVDDVQKLLRASLPKHVLVDVDVPDGLPAIEGDASQLRQVLMNLVLNGAEAIGERPGRVVVRAERVELGRDVLRKLRGGDEIEPGAFVRLTVEDDGPGMDEATRARVFDPFFSTKLTGRGLGLAAVSGIVKTHRGLIDVRSELGEGTTFEVLLRASPELSAEELVEVARVPEPTGHAMAVRRPAAAETGDEPGAARPIVLIADDETQIRAVVTLALEDAGYEVLTAEDGAAAVEIAEERASELDVVLLDVTMPRMSGVNAVSAIREACDGVSIVLMSGYEEDVVDTSEVFLRKPFSIMALTEAVAEAAERRRASRRDGHAA
jgi:CheY-like chemotaxis protein